MAIDSSFNHPLRFLVRKLKRIGTGGADEWQAIERLPFQVKNVPSRYDIVHIGDSPTYVCLILSGWACRYTMLDHGKRQILSFHMPGDIPDLMSLHLGVMDHSLCTLGPATVAFIPHKGIRELTTEYPSLAATLWRETLIDAASFRQGMVGIGRRSAAERIAHLLCELYVRQRAMGLAADFYCSAPFTQTDLADALGLTNVHVNRVLKDLRTAGLLTLRGREFVIHNWAELTSLGEFDPIYLHLNVEATDLRR